MRYYIKDNYYFDIDHFNQLRITGPLNHLLLGMSFPKGLDLEIASYDIVKGQLEILVRVPTDHLDFKVPLVTDIRTLRSYVEPVVPKPTYEQLIAQGARDILPKKIERHLASGTTVLEFSNTYIDDSGETRTYGAELFFDKRFTVDLDGDVIKVVGKEPIELKIKTKTNIVLDDFITADIFKSDNPLPVDLFSPFLVGLYEESQTHIEHLIRAKKTSSFEYGTIFPRDWIESADLGRDDFTQDTVDYMYAQSMRFISDAGEAWHEDVVGEYKTKISDQSMHIDRKMIDIEPRYILGMRRVSKKFLTEEENQRKLRLVAHYILSNAREQEYITFKKRPTETEEEYHPVGNWRDSYMAFPRQKSPLAPYDVNCVFYPMALRIIREYYQYFQITDIDELGILINAWEKQKEKFRLYHPGGIIGYSLALHGKKNMPLPISHLDESYDLFYGSPSLEEISSFARKVVNPDYFYTPVGPILVARDEDEFSIAQYHGKVIWPKQSAYVVAGLARQYRRGLHEQWPWPIVQSIKEAVIKTSEACFKGWTDLGVVPELYYYDEKSDTARLYTDQPNYEGQMSIIQLWSSVGLRKIMQEYAAMHSVV